MEIKPYLIAPKLIPQPTWGGNYIAQLKGLSTEMFGKLLIGQSYELSTESMLSSVTDATKMPVEIGDPKTGETTEVIGDRTSLFSLQSLIDSDPNAVLGKRVVQKHGNTMQVLIKFTQAKGNSFQVHVRPSQQLGHWKPKPESWYYFEDGKATLGLNNPTPQRLAAYKQSCQLIDQKAQELSTQVQEGKLPVEDARAQLHKIIEEQNPFQYVNTVNVPKDTIIDLCDGGIHHSWEEGDSIPLGNIVYEVQLNVMDNDCTIRSFDKGKMGDDGRVRPAHVEDYFQSLDIDATRNASDALIRTMVKQSIAGITCAQLFDTPYYRSELLELAGEYSGEKTSPAKDESFHHIFVKEGVCLFRDGNSTFQLPTGTSLFVPADVDYYTITCDQKSIIVKTIA